MIDSSALIWTIVLCAIATYLTRRLPFALGAMCAKDHPMLCYIQEAMPGAIMTILVLYSLSGIDWSIGDGVAEILAVILTAVLHLWRKNALISIFGGVACYMLLIRFVLG